MSDVRVGQLIPVGTPPCRDAIHVPIITAICRDPLSPGDHVSVIRRVGPAVVLVRQSWDDPAGVADPFIRDTIPARRWFWLFLYPGKIRDLRHQWESRAVDGAPTVVGTPLSESDLTMRGSEIVEGAITATRIDMEDYNCCPDPEDESNCC